MSLRRAVPNFQHLFRQLEDSVGSMLSSRVPSSMLSPTSTIEGSSGLFFNQPSTDLRETDKSYIIEAEIPGLRKEDVTMELVNDKILRFSGKFSSETTEEDKNFWSKERMVGDFYRAFTFPTPIDPEKIKATMENGVLKVEIEKTGQEEAKKIPVKIN